MARGSLTEKDLETLKKNKYVVYADKDKIVYSNEFKFYFIDEYKKKNKRPREIFAEAGFDIEALGAKRIERCAARWRESDLAGTLGNYDIYLRNGVRTTKLKEDRDIKNERIEKLKARVEELEEKCLARQKKYLDKKYELDSFYEERLELKHLKQENKILRAQVEALNTIHLTEKEKYDYSKKDKDAFYELALYLLEKYDVELGMRALLKVMGVSESGFRKFRREKLEEK